MDPQTRQRAYELYSNGFGFRKISRLTGISTSTLKTFIRKQFKSGLLERHPRCDPKVEQNQRILELWNQGHRSRVIARDLDLNRRTVQVCIQCLIKNHQISKSPPITDSDVESFLDKFS